jgi:hypothetical protein
LLSRDHDHLIQQDNAFRETVDVKRFKV